MNPSHPACSLLSVLTDILAPTQYKYTKFVDMFMFYLHAKFHISIYSCSLSPSNGEFLSSFNQLLLSTFVTLPDKYGSDLLSHHQCLTTSVRGDMCLPETVTTVINSSLLKDDKNYELLVNICKIKWITKYRVNVTAVLPFYILQEKLHQQKMHMF
jgi:hypothetical protein